MTKYKVKVTRIEEYIITVDETLWTEKNMKKYSDVITEVLDLEDIASEAAIQQFNNTYIELKGVEIEELDKSFDNYDLDIKQI